MSRSVPARTAAALALLFLFPLAGCRHKASVDATPPKLAPPPEVSEVDIQAYKPNEAGSVMVLMYHQFKDGIKESDMNRTPEHFRKDLDDLYTRGYRPVTLSQFIQNRMDVPAGKTPIVLTFDDAWPTQFTVITGSDGKPHIDPNCGVGILETFAKAHPDWKNHGTFFVLPHEGRNGDPFGQPDMVAQKLAYLLKNGYEIGNHTSTHSDLRRMAPERIRWEIATAAKDIKAIDPGAQMQLLSLPYGNVPRSAEALKALREGQDGGTTYHNIGVVRAAWRPVLSPVTKRPAKARTSGGISYAYFDPYAIERIKEDPAQAKFPGTLEYWLKYFDANPSERYVSGGNPRVCVVPRHLKPTVDEARVRAQGKIVQYYPKAGAAGTGGSAGADLSVQ